MILRDVRKDAQTRNWAPTECTFLESGVVPEQDANGGYLFSVCHAWRASGGADAVHGQQHTGTTYSPGHSASRDYRDARRPGRAVPRRLEGDLLRQRGESAAEPRLMRASM